MIVTSEKMRARAASAIVTVVVLCAVGARGTRYAFYRDLSLAWSGPDERSGRDGDGGRRVFGGETAKLSDYPAACALLDRYWTARCSGAVVSARWALTAAHCITSNIAYIKYNSRLPSSNEGDVAPVHYLYRHPDYKVVQEDEGRGMDVTMLHHDVGLVRTRNDMVLAARPPVEPLRAMRLYDAVDLKNDDVQVLGFGRTEKSKLGEELFEVRLQLVACERGSWLHCVCGVARREASAAGRGVCSGDSGGPVMHRGAQVAVTSMGPLECASPSGGSGSTPAGTATSVFTSLHPYADLINDTIYDTEAAMRMSRMSRAANPCATHTATLAALAALMLSTT